MLKTFKVQLKPNNKQQTRLFEFAYAARFAYNWTVAQFLNSIQQKTDFLEENILRKNFTSLKKQKEYSWLYTVSNTVTKQGIRDAYDALKRYKKGQNDFPKFKKKTQERLSFYQDSNVIEFKKGKVKIEALAGTKKRKRLFLNWISLVEKETILENQKYLNPRVVFDGLNWWVCVTIDLPNIFQENINDGIGIDLGVKTFAVCSNGQTFPDISRSSKIKKLAKKVAIMKQDLKKMANGQNKKKKEKKILKKSQKIKNIKYNYLYWVVSEIIKQKPRFIVIEDLDITNMGKSRKELKKMINREYFYTFRKILEYKCKWAGIEIIVADRYFPSSKICCVCGKLKENLTLKDRIYECKCGNKIDRDYQAALNLKKYGENIIFSE